jgi:Tfp pilus assembly protein PilW
MLVEALMAIGITGLLMLALVSILMFSSRSFAALFNYVDLDDVNRLAIDQLTRDVRECNYVSACTTNSLALVDSDGFNLSYNYSPTAKTLTRVKNGINKVVLTGCDSMSFTLGQRNPVGGSYDVYPSAAGDPTQAKVINVAWSCSRSILGIKQNTESVQTARIVIRKQGT